MGHLEHFGSKLRVLIIAKWEWPETAKNRGEPRKMTHSSETEISLGGGPTEKVVALDIRVICPADRKIAIPKQEIVFLPPNIQTFGSQLHIFTPSG